MADLADDTNNIGDLVRGLRARVRLERSAEAADAQVDSKSGPQGRTRSDAPPGAGPKVPALETLD